MGVYSHLSEYSNQFMFLDDFSYSMHQLGYNTNVMETISGGPNLNAIYYSLNNNGIDAIVIDNNPNNTTGNEKYSTNRLSAGSYYSFEAEYKDETAVTNDDQIVSQYWYGTRDGDFTYDPVRIGSQSFSDFSPPPQNGRVWKCTPGVSGWAYTDLRWRWKANDLNSSPSLSIRIGKEFKLKKKCVY